VPSIPVGGGGGGVVGGGSHEHGSHEKGKKKCLHWNGRVQLFSESNETRSAHELEIGDRVLAYSKEKGFHASPVVSILNRDLIATREFVRVTTSQGSRVSLTAEHGVYSGRCSDAGESWTEKRADALSTGDCVKMAHGGEDRIVEIDSFFDSGVVKPITESGSIVVDGVVVSCYDYAEEADNAWKTNPHEIYEPYRLLYSVGERLYKGMREGKFAVEILETLISATGLEKMYS